MKYTHRIRIILSLHIRESHTRALYLFVCACVSQLVLGTHLVEAVSAGRPQVWRDNAGDRGRERSKEVTGVATGTRPIVFKWKTIRNWRPPTDKMKPHGK